MVAMEPVPVVTVLAINLYHVVIPPISLLNTPLLSPSRLHATTTRTKFFVSIVYILYDDGGVDV